MAGYLGSLLLFFMAFFVAVAAAVPAQGLGTLLDPIGIRFIVEDLAHHWTHDREEPAPDRAGGHDAHEPPPVARHRARRRSRSPTCASASRIAPRAAWWRRSARRRGCARADAAVGASRARAPISVPQVRADVRLRHRRRARRSPSHGPRSGRSRRAGPGSSCWSVIPLLTVLVVIDQMALQRRPAAPDDRARPRRADGAAVRRAEPLGDHPAPHRLLRRRAGLAGARCRAERDHRRDAGLGMGPFLGKFLGLGLVLVAVHGAPDGGRDARPGDPGLPRLRDRAVPEDPVRASAPRIPALRRARPRGARGGEPEVRRPPGGASWPTCSSPARGACSASSTTCSSTAPARGGPTRRCAASARPSGRGSGSSSTGRRGRCCSRWWRGCSGCAAGRAASASRLADGARVASRVRRRWIAGAAAVLVLALGGFIFYNTNVLNEYLTASDDRRSGAPSTSGATGGTRVSRSPG